MMDLVSRFRTMYSRRGPGGAAIGVVSWAVPHPYNTWIEILEEEFDKGLAAPLSPSQRINLYREGFQSQLYYLYGFDQGESHDKYLNEFARKGYTGQINGEASDILNDKIRFHEYISRKGYEEYLPRVFGTIEGGRFVSDCYTTLRDLFDDVSKIVIKDVSGAAGDGVYICKHKGNTIIVNGESHTRADFRLLMERVNKSIVTEFCTQASYLHQIYPHSSNTLRVLIMSPSSSDPFIAIAVQRIGSNRSGGLDNFSQGGMSAEVNIESGEFGPAAEYTQTGPQWHQSHPDTDAQIEGVTVPQWTAIKNQLLDLTADMPELSYVAWDVLVTGDGEFVLIEGNNRSDVDLLQVHRPLLADPKVRRFYADHGVPV